MWSSVVKTWIRPDFIRRLGLNSRRLFASLMVSVMYCGVAAHATTPDEEKRLGHCPEGAYSGAASGAQTFTQDPYVWFVSREFAKRFCMPEQFIDDSLKGALAVAVRLKPNEEITCGLLMGRSDLCPASNRLLLDIYVDNRKANIPKADPSVEFYSGRIWNSEWYTGINGARAKKRHKGVVTELPGQRRPYNPAISDTVDQRNATQFLYLGVRNGWATQSGSFIEDYYRANWAEGIDLITLDGYLFGYKGLSNPELQVQTDGRRYRDSEYDQSNPIQRWAIGVIQGKDYFRDQEKPGIPYPRGYTHTIELPHKVAQMIYAYDHKEGEQFFKNVQDAMRSLAPSKP